MSFDRYYRFLPLNGLRAFEAAARHGSFKKAAEELFVTPTAVSHQIKALEDCLGVQLFHRLTRALALTAEGEAILPKVSKGLECLAAAVEQTRDPRHLGTLSVTAPPTFAARWLVPRLRGFTAAHSEVQLHLSSSFKTIDGADRGAAFPIDASDTHDGATGFAICFGLGRYPGCRVDLVFAADYFPVCSPALLKGKRPLRTPQDLRWHVLIHDDTIPDEANRPTWEEWLEVAGVHGVNPHLGPRFSDVSLALEAARDGARGSTRDRTARAGRDRRRTASHPLRNAAPRALRVLPRGPVGARRATCRDCFPSLVAGRGTEGTDTLGDRPSADGVTSRGPLLPRLSCLRGGHP